MKLKLKDFISGDYKEYDVYSTFAETYYIDTFTYHYPIKVTTKCELTEQGKKIYSDILNLNVCIDELNKVVTIFMASKKTCSDALMEYRNNKVAQLLNIVKLLKYPNKENEEFLNELFVR